jgi:5'-nucleotidase
MGRARAGNKDASLTPYDLRLEGRLLRAFSCDASPAAVVLHTLRVFPEYKPALLVSGINYGENIGVFASGSGTVGAALEGACAGIPSLAMSLETTLEANFQHTDEDWTAAAYFTHFFARIMLAHALPPDVHIVKVEVPAGATPQTPWRVCGLTPHEYYQGYLPHPHPGSKRRDIVRTKASCVGDDPATDGYAVAVDKVVAVTPLSVDFTSRCALSAFQQWLAG